MSEPTNLSSFDDAIRHLAETVYRHVQTELGDSHWTHATLDVRFDKHGASWLTKIRVATPLGTPLSLKMKNDIDLVLITLNSIRATVFEHEWYGLLLDIDTERRCNINLNYDPNCSEDAAFYDS